MNILICNQINYLNGKSVVKHFDCRKKEIFFHSQCCITGLLFKSKDEIMDEKLCAVP